MLIRRIHPKHFYRKVVLIDLIVNVKSLTYIRMHQVLRSLAKPVLWMKLHAFSRCIAFLVRQHKTLKLFYRDV